MTPKHIDENLIHPIYEMKGESDKESQGFVADLEKAESYILGKKWCSGISERYFGMGLGGVISTFLFRIIPKGEVDEWLWLISGDVPNAYLVIDEIPTPEAAILEYCDLMEDWSNAVLGSGDLEDVFPVDAPPTKANAESLRERIGMIRKDILPSIT